MMSSLCYRALNAVVRLPARASSAVVRRVPTSVSASSASFSSSAAGLMAATQRLSILNTPTSFSSCVSSRNYSTSTPYAMAVRGRVGRGSGTRLSHKKSAIKTSTSGVRKSQKKRVVSSERRAASGLKKRGATRVTGRPRRRTALAIQREKSAKSFAAERRRLQRERRREKVEQEKERRAERRHLLRQRRLHKKEELHVKAQEKRETLKERREARLAKVNEIAEARHSRQAALAKRHKRRIANRFGDPNKPKAPPSAYLSFFRENSKAIFAKAKANHQKASDAVKEIAASWKALAVEEKNKRIEAYNKLSQEFKAALEKYNASHSPPKKPQTAFFRYATANRGSASGKPQEITKKLGQQWKSLSEAQKEPYIKAANQEMEQWKVANAAWVKSHPHDVAVKQNLYAHLHPSKVQIRQQVKSVVMKPKAPRTN